MADGKGIAKAIALGSFVIVLFGGIGAVCFPYVLRKAKLIIAPILTVYALGIAVAFMSRC